MYLVCISIKSINEPKMLCKPPIWKLFHFSFPVFLMEILSDIGGTLNIPSWKHIWFWLIQANVFFSSYFWNSWIFRLFIYLISCFFSRDSSIWHYVVTNAIPFVIWFFGFLGKIYWKLINQLTFLKYFIIFWNLTYSRLMDKNDSLGQI